MRLEELERELIDRGYRIKYRRPDDHCIWTYQLERGGWTGGFRITEQVVYESVWPAPKLVSYIERQYGWPLR